jgi:hypothetical protein
MEGTRLRSTDTCPLGADGWLPVSPGRPTVVNTGRHVGPVHCRSLPGNVNGSPVISALHPDTRGGYTPCLADPHDSW